MLWLDGTLSVPAVGIQLVSDFSSLCEIQNRVVPLFDEIQQKHGKLKIKHEQIWGYIVETADGFSFNITPTNIFSHFSYPLKRESKAGQFAELKKPDFRTYTDLLNQIVSHLYEIANLIGDLSGIYYNRIGIVSNSELDDNSCPPGLITWIKHMSKPWGTPLTETAIRLVAELNTGENFSERCHHILNFDSQKKEEKGYSFTLDWQKVWNEGDKVMLKNLKKDLPECKELAVAYYSKFAEGDLDYE